MRVVSGIVEGSARSEASGLVVRFLGKPSAGTVSAPSSRVNSPLIESTEFVYRTEWFGLCSKRVKGWRSPHYSIQTKDYVSVLACTGSGAFPLVRQYRPAVERETLELPSGHVELGETPEQAARNELLEETGYRCGELIFLGQLAPDTGRLANGMWCFFAPGVELVEAGQWRGEVGVEPVLWERGLRELLLEEPAFSSAINRATILMAVARGLIVL